MKALRIITLSIAVIVLIFPISYAKNHLPEERGKKLFNDSKFAGGLKSCNTCHPGGKGIENAADKKDFKLMGKTAKSLEEAVNICIEMGNRGKPIDVKSDQMKDIVAYIKSLKSSKKPSTGY